MKTSLKVFIKTINTVRLRILTADPPRLTWTKHGSCEAYAVAGDPFGKLCLRRTTEEKIWKNLRRKKKFLWYICWC